MRGTIHINDQGIIHVVPIGLSDFNQAYRVNLLLDEIVGRLRFDHQPVLIFTDISGVTGATAGGRMEAFRIVRTLDYDKLAVFGGNPIIAGIAKFILLSSGSLKTKYFNSRRKAMSWLEAVSVSSPA